MTLEELLWEWAGKLFMAGVVFSAVAAVYLIGRAHGRQAQRRATVRTAVEDAIAQTIVIPRPRSEADR
jgi:hypothetical protein